MSDKDKPVGSLRPDESKEKRTRPDTGASRMSEHIRYLGTLGLLSECSVFVPEDIRQMIEMAFSQACHANPQLRTRRILDRIEISVDIPEASATNPPASPSSPQDGAPKKETL